MYRLTNENYFYLFPENTKESEGDFVHLADYSELDILDNRARAPGSDIICQEVKDGHCIIRSGCGISYMSHNATSATQNGPRSSYWGNPYMGWRPVLEKVS